LFAESNDTALPHRRLELFPIWLLVGGLEISYLRQLARREVWHVSSDANLFLEPRDLSNEPSVSIKRGKCFDCLSGY